MEFLSCTATDCLTTNSVVSETKASNVVRTSLEETTDDGASWKDLGVIPGLGSITAFACASPGQCVVAGDRPDFSGYAAVFTDDYGSTWRFLAGLRDTRFGLSAIECSTRSRCVATGADLHGAVLFTSTDGGRRFRPERCPRVKV
jgi:photosystem II stability/assembly factor-like uncharacterized protein